MAASVASSLGWSRFVSAWGASFGLGERAGLERPRLGVPSSARCVESARPPAAEFAPRFALRGRRRASRPCFEADATRSRPLRVTRRHGLRAPAAARPLRPRVRRAPGSRPVSLRRRCPPLRLTRRGQFVLLLVVARRGLRGLRARPGQCRGQACACRSLHCRRPAGRFAVDHRRPRDAQSGPARRRRPDRVAEPSAAVPPSSPGSCSSCLKRIRAPRPSVAALDSRKTFCDSPIRHAALSACPTPCVGLTVRDTTSCSYTGVSRPQVVQQVAHRFGPVPHSGIHSARRASGSPRTPRSSLAGSRHEGGGRAHALPVLPDLRQPCCGQSRSGRWERQSGVVGPAVRAVVDSPPSKKPRCSSSSAAAPPSLSARDKVISGVRKACQGRPVDEDALAVLAQRVEEAVRAAGRAEVSSDDVGRAILGPLRDLDEVAYLRFASVYRAFDSLEDFEQEIASLRRDHAPDSPPIPLGSPDVSAAGDPRSTSAHPPPPALAAAAVT